MQYVALLRGIMPTNPNMRGEKLKVVFEALGFENIHTVIASGNVVFESPEKNPFTIEEKIEKELPKILGFNSTTIVRSRQELEMLAKKNPFKDVKDEKPHYMIVTFFKDRRKELCTVINLSQSKTPDVMGKLEKEYGKAITTRTWKTVNRILEKMSTVSAL